MSKHEFYENPLCGRYAGEDMKRLFSDDYKFSTWRRLWVALAESEKDGLANISEENSGATLAAERLLKKAGYETALTRWGGASQTPVLVYVLVAAAAVLVIVLIVLLCGMKKRPREK